MQTDILFTVNIHGKVSLDLKGLETSFVLLILPVLFCLNMLENTRKSGSHSVMSSLGERTQECFSNRE